MRTAPALTLTISFAILLADCVGAGVARQRESAVGACEVRELERRDLVLPSGEQLLTTFTTVAIQGDTTLIIGRPSSLFRASPGGDYQRVGRDSVVGAVLTRGGPLRPVLMPPVLGEVGGLKAVTLSGGRFGVVFDIPDMATSKQPPLDGALYFGILRGTEWQTIERIPTPPGLARAWGLSSLSAWGDTIVWAVPVAIGPQEWRALVATRIDGKWTTELAPAGNITSVAALADRSRIILAVAHPDTALAVDANSMFVLTRDSAGWSPQHKIAAGVIEPVFQPSLARLADGETIVTWYGPFVRERRFWVTRDVLGPRTRPVRVLSDVDHIAEVRGRQLLWLADAADSVNGRHLLLIRLDHDSARTVATMRNPFVRGAPFTALMLAPSVMMVVGLRWDVTQTVVPPSTQVLYLNLSCDDAVG